MALEIRPVPHGSPETMDLMTLMAEVFRRELMHTVGDEDLADSAEVFAASYDEQRYRTKHAFVALDGGRAVGGGWFGLPLPDNTQAIEGNVSVDPDADAAEVVPAVWEAARQLGVDAGRTKAMLWSSHRLADGTGEHLVPRTGVSRLPRDPLATALAGLGLTLEQVERHSVMEVAEGLDLAAAELPRAREAAGTAYRTLSWTGPTPAEHLAGMAALMARMSTDVPSGDLEIEPEVWDADRVAEGERVTESLGRTLVTTVAQHVETGELVAYTYFMLPGDKPQVGYQEDTLVHAGHRGHRLGMLVKALNLQQLHQVRPDVVRLHTWNAGENEHMLAINEALGFRERTAEGAWQLTGLS